MEKPCYPQATLPNPASLSLTQTVLTGAGLAVRFVSGRVHQAGLLVVTATAGASPAVCGGARALAGVGVARLLALALQQGERVAVGIPKHWGEGAEPLITACDVTEMSQ